MVRRARSREGHGCRAGAMTYQGWWISVKPLVSSVNMLLLNHSLRLVVWTRYLPRKYIYTYYNIEVDSQAVTM